MEAEALKARLRGLLDEADAWDRAAEAELAAESGVLPSERVETIVGLHKMRTAAAKAQPKSGRGRRAKTRGRPAGSEQSDLTRAAIGEKNRVHHALFSDWLVKKHMTVRSWVEQHTDAAGNRRWSPSAVYSWIAAEDTEQARAIPEDAALLIEAEAKDPETGISAVPATDASWPSGISRK